jgi:hypothetical protein
MADGKPAVELSFRFELDWGPNAAGWTKDDAPQPYLLCGHLDRVVNYADSLYVMDRKTSVTTISGYYFDQWSPNNQMSLYSLAGKIMLNSPIKGVIIDAAQVMLEKPNAFARGFAYRTPDQLDEWLLDLRYNLAQAEAYATANYWPQNDTSCTKYGGCQFKEVCSKSPAIRETYLKGTFDKTGLDQAWNPFYERT